MVAHWAVWTSRERREIPLCAGRRVHPAEHPGQAGSEREEEASACSVRNDGWCLKSRMRKPTGFVWHTGWWTSRERREIPLCAGRRVHPAEHPGQAGSEREEEASACFVRSDVGCLKWRSKRRRPAPFGMTLGCLKSRMKGPTGFAGLKPGAYIGSGGAGWARVILTNTDANAKCGRRNRSEFRSGPAHARVGGEPRR
jgi:hypothetical protein